MQICLIDDEPIVLDTISGFLADLGHSVICARSEADMLELPDAQKTDLVITDLQLPGQTGYNSVRRALEFFPDTPIVVISGYREALLSLPEEIEEELYACLPKPFSLEELERLLERLSGGAR
ncbi:MAG: response regulator [Deltaproteobacteria bacterium]|nr:response regulator [Deltaproteobacteria bacterium]